MALWKRGRRYWTYFSVNGVQLRRPLCPLGSTLATTNWQEATRLEKEMIRAALAGELAPRDPSVKLFAAVDDYLGAKKATANSKRTIEFDRERLEIVKRHLGDVKLSTITRKVPDVFVPACLTPGTTALLVVHNHPSGDPTPSPDDARLTLRLAQAADVLDLPLLDHLIVGDAGRYFSFREAGTLATQIAEEVRA